MNILEIEGLTKYYGDKKALEDLHLEIKKGEIFGFLGPNGAGKTTTIRILLDFIRPTRGRARILGYDTQKETAQVKKYISYLPSEFGLYSHLSVGDFLKYFSRYASNGSAKNIAPLAERFNMDLKKKIKDLSHGMRQKTAIMLGFMREPDLYILDEPTQGLDPLMQEEFYQLLKEQRIAGRTAFFSSHVLSEVEKVCDRCAIIKDGKLLEVESVARLKERRYKKIEVLFPGEIPALEFEKMEGVQKVERKEKRLKIYLNQNLPQMLSLLCQHKIEDITVQEPSLEEVFLEYYKK